MASKRIKISFSSINEGKYTTFNKNDIAKSNQRVKVEMKNIKRKFEKKETQSQQQAALLVLNA